MDGEPIVVLDGLVRRFGTLTAVDDISLTVHPGEVVALLGHNGAGKTTLLRLINGLLAPTAGTIRTHGLDPQVDGQQVRSQTGVLTEYPALDDFLTTAENLAAYGAIHGLDAATIEQRSRQILERLDLSDKRDVYARGLSAGLKQRVALARALLHRPALLLLDEPTANLDPIAARRVRTLVSELARDHDVAVILSTHNLAEAAAVANRVAVIRNGRLLALGRPDQLGAESPSSCVLVTVAPDDVVTALRVATWPGGPGPLLQADEVTIEVTLPASDIPHLVASMVRGGVAIHAVAPQQPSLEDIYVALHNTAAVS